MNTLLVKMLFPFRRVFEVVGVNFDQLIAIVSVKLMMDNRRQIVSYRRKENAEPTNNFLLTVFFYALFGAFIAIGIMSIPSLILSMTLFFSYVIVMVAMTLITDFSSTLLDTSDNTIILPRPVSARTLFVSRLVHILFYLGQIMIGLIIAPAIVVWFKYGLLTLFSFLVGATLSVVFAVVLTNGFYLLILNIASEEKLKTVINYFQIVMAVAVMGGYQILPRMLGRFDLADYVFVISWWNYFVPPIWMAAAVEAIHYGMTDLQHIAMTVLAVAIPLAGMHAVNKFLSPVFARKLGALGIDTSRNAPKKSSGQSVAGRISKSITATLIERSIFELVYNLLARDRKIKLRIYPTIGYVAIFGIIFLMRERQSLESTLSHLPETEYFIVLIYLAFMVLQIVAFEIPFSDDFKASWIYSSVPLARPGEILTATLKAIVVRLFVPIYLVLSLIIFSVWGIKTLDDLIVGLFNNMLMLMVVVLLNNKYLPFSIAPNARNQSGNFVRSLMTMLLIVGIGFGHAFLARFPTFMLVGIPLQLGLLYAGYRYYSNTRWSDITL